MFKISFKYLDVVLKSINNISMLIIRKRHHKVPYIPYGRHNTGILVYAPFCILLLVPSLQKRILENTGTGNQTPFQIWIFENQ